MVILYGKNLKINNKMTTEEFAEERLCSFYEMDAKERKCIFGKDVTRCFVEHGCMPQLQTGLNENEYTTGSGSNIVIEFKNSPAISILFNHHNQMVITANV